MLTLTFLGVGSAFAKRNLQSNALLEAWSNAPGAQSTPDDTLLIDFGATGPMALNQLKQCDGFGYLDCDGLVNYPAIARVLVTHLHADHIGGLEEMALMNRYVYGKRGECPVRRTQLICPVAIKDDLWNHSLKGGLGVLPGRKAELADYFSVATIGLAGMGGPDHIDLLGRYRITLFRTHHIQVNQRYDWPSFGVLLTDLETKETVFYSGDTRYDPNNEHLAFAARTIFHDVQLEDSDDCVHATLGSLRSLPEEIRRKTVLYHYGDAWDDQRYEFVDEEFAGFANPMRRYDLFGGHGA